MQLNKLMILLHLQRQKDQLPKLLLHFSAIWKEVKIYPMSGTSLQDINPHLPPLRYCSGCTLAVTVLPVPRVSQQQHGPDFQRFQWFWSCLELLGVAEKENGTQQTEDRKCTIQVQFRSNTAKSCLPQECLTVSSLLPNSSITMHFTWSWKK